MTTSVELVVNDSNREAYGHIMAFDPAKDNLYIYGSCGVGKTNLAKILLQKWSERIGTYGGYPLCELIEWQDYKSRVNGFQKSPRDLENEIKYLKGRRVL